MAIMSAAATAAELQRKKNLGIAPTSSSNAAAYNKLTAKPAVAGSGVIPTTNQPAISQPFDLSKAYENNQKMNYRQQGINALKPAEPFKMDLASIQSDPTYQAAMASAKEATQVAEGDISAAMNRRGIMDSTINANAASNAAQQEYGKVNRELLPRLIEDQYKRYMDQNATNRQYAGDLFGVSDMYGNDEQQNFNNAISESGVTGSYMPPGATDAINQLLTLKQQAEQAGISREERAALSKRADNIRLSLQAFGVDPSKFGANVNSSTASQNVGSSGIKTLAAQGQEYNQMADNREYEYRQARDAIADDRYKAEFDEDLRRYGLEFAIDKQVKLGNLALNQAQERRVAANQSSGSSGSSRSSGGSSGSGSSKPSTESTIQDINMPRTAASMETYIISKLPGGKNVAGPPSPNQPDLIEEMILSNDNLSDADRVKLYKRFGIPLPE